MLALLGLLMMGCCLLSACSASVENTPEGVATFVVNSYMKGKYPDTRDGAVPGADGAECAASRNGPELVQQLSRTIGNYIADHKGTCKVYPAPFAVFLNQVQLLSASSSRPDDAKFSAMCKCFSHSVF